MPHCSLSMSSAHYGLVALQDVQSNPYPLHELTISEFACGYSISSFISLGIANIHVYVVWNHTKLSNWVLPVERVNGQNKELKELKRLTVFPFNRFVVCPGCTFCLTAFDNGIQNSKINYSLETATEDVWCQIQNCFSMGRVKDYKLR